MTNASMAMPTRRVDLWFSGPAPQRRVTVIFRIILAIPQFIVLFFLGIAAFFVVLIGWFAALFTGRFPEFAANFVGGFIRWEIRVNAYMFLLTDTYPPFTFDDVDYPVRIVLPAGGPLNRLSVLFRFFLAIPAFFFAQIVANGLTAPLLFIMWIVVIVSGKMPDPLYGAYSALVRYQARFHSWYNMITSEYPWGMMGDAVPPAPATPPPRLGTAPGVAPGFPAPPSAQAPAPQAVPPTPPSAQPPAQPFSYPTPGERAATPPPDASGAGAPPEWPPPMPAPPAGAAGVPSAPGAMPPPSPWERTSVASSFDTTPPWGVLVLKGAARGWMIFAIVWGSLVLVGQLARNGGGNHHNNNMSGLVTTVPAATSGHHLIIQTPSDF